MHSLKLTKVNVAVAVSALIGVGALIFGTDLRDVSSHQSHKSEEQAAGPERLNDQAASRGNSRTADHLTSAMTPEMVAAATRADLVAPTDEPDPTTTTTFVPASTTTTVIAQTTTSAPPVTAAKESAQTKAPAKTGSGGSQSGGASYYSQPWASKGCAHRTLPKGTVLTVTNVANGKTATCVVNDRGPFIAGRILDLDVSIFKQVASTSAGVFNARISW